MLDEEATLFISVHLTVPRAKVGCDGRGRQNTIFSVSQRELEKVFTYIDWPIMRVMFCVTPPVTTPSSQTPELQRAP